MILAEILPAQPSPVALALWLALFSALTLVVIGRMISGIRRYGVQTRPDLLDATDVLVASAIMICFLMIIANRFGASNSAPVKLVVLEPWQLVSSMIGLLIFPCAVVLMMIARNVKPVDVFGLGKVRVGRACAVGAGIGVLALPLTLAVKTITVHLTDSHEGSQQLVKAFSTAVSGGAWQMFGLIALSAVVVAPLSEEVLFRGYFYPVLGRWFGRVSASFLAAVFFGAMHDTLTDIPGLAVLALCLTVAYERTGSLIVPLAGHACFNAVSLLLLWCQAKNILPL